MARLNVYIPDELAEAARSAGLNVSGLTQDAIRSALAASATDIWLDRLSGRQPIDVTRERILSAVAEGREDLLGRG